MVATNRSGGDRVANGDDTFPRDGLPSRPMGLTKDQSQIWTDLMSQLPNELLRRIDTVNMKSLVITIWSRDKLAEAVTNDPSDLKVFTKFLAASQAIIRLSSMYGMSPIDRRRMKIAQQQEEESEWD